MTTQISSTFATYFPVRVCPSLLKLRRTSSQTLISILFSKLHSAISNQQRGIKIKQQTHHKLVSPLGSYIVIQGSL